MWGIVYFKNKPYICIIVNQKKIMNHITFEAIEFVVSFPSEWTEEEAKGYVGGGRFRDQSEGFSFKKISVTKWRNFKCVAPNLLGRPDDEAWFRIAAKSKWEPAVSYLFKPHFTFIGETPEPLGDSCTEFRGIEIPTLQMARQARMHAEDCVPKKLTIDQLPKGAVVKW